jgi:hypothetical protein
VPFPHHPQPSPLLQTLGTNHPASDYKDEPLLEFLGATSRDDVIYGLKACAKKGLPLRKG